ncbi:hypothetical protein [Microcoleus sp. FACHB-SPT15]|nr:hypothetical protein [Microcoleus sp. FACHB-SPT15]
MHGLIRCTTQLDGSITPLEITISMVSIHRAILGYKKLTRL